MVSGYFRDCHFWGIVTLGTLLYCYHYHGHLPLLWSSSSSSLLILYNTVSLEILVGWVWLQEVKWLIPRTLLRMTATPRHSISNFWIVASLYCYSQLLKEFFTIIIIFQNNTGLSLEKTKTKSLIHSIHNPPQPISSCTCTSAFFSGSKHNLSVLISTRNFCYFFFYAF